MESLTTAFVAGLVVAVIAMMFQIVSPAAAATYSADGSQPIGAAKLVLPGVIGALAGTGAFVLQWNSPGNSGRKKRRRQEIPTDLL